MDGLSIVLDTFNDIENALCFNVTPAGSRMDAAVSNDAQNQTELICREQLKELFFREELV